MSLEIEHIIPEAAGGSSEEESLAICPSCNRYKAHKHTHLTQKQVKLYRFSIHVRKPGEHFAWDQRASAFVGLTPMDATVQAFTDE